VSSKSYRSSFRKRGMHDYNIKLENLANCEALRSKGGREVLPLLERSASSSGTKCFLIRGKKCEEIFIAYPRWNREAQGGEKGK